MKRSPLLRRTPLDRGTTPMARRALNRRQRTRRRASDDEFGQEFWAVQRGALYARAGGCCELGGCSLDQHGMEAHHRLRRSQGHDHGLHNLAALCPEGHRWVHAHPAQARRLGFLVPSWGSPHEVPMQIHAAGLVLLTSQGTYEPTEAPR